MTILEILNNELIKIFDKFGYDKKYAFFQYSDRPDLSDFQTNCAMPLCKILRKSPIDVAKTIIPELQATKLFKDVSVAGAYDKANLGTVAFAGKAVELAVGEIAVAPKDVTVEQ